MKLIILVKNILLLFVLGFNAFMYIDISTGQIDTPLLYLFNVVMSISIVLCLSITIMELLFDAYNFIISIYNKYKNNQVK